MDQSNIKTGELHLIIGPMFASKTSEMIKTVRLYRYSGHKCILIHYTGDSRYSKDEVACHNGMKMPAVSTLELETVKETVSHYDVIGIDEGQFFSDIVPFCKELLKNGKILVVNGLDATFLRTGFENILNLVPLCHSIKKLSAICMSCGRKAAFTKRLGTETDIVVIGASDKYMAVCRECYKIPQLEKSSPFKRMEQVHKIKEETLRAKSKIVF